MTIQQFEKLSPDQQKDIFSLYEDAQEQAGTFELEFEVYLQSRELPVSIGDKVYWTDPANNECSGEYTVKDISGEIFICTNEQGSELECYEHELNILERASKL